MKQIIDRCYQIAREIIEKNREKLNLMIDALMRYETLDKNQIDAIMAGKKPPKPKGWVKISKKLEPVASVFAKEDENGKKTKKKSKQEKNLEEIKPEIPPEEIK